MNTFLSITDASKPQKPMLRKSSFSNIDFVLCYIFRVFFTHRHNVLRKSDFPNMSNQTCSFFSISSTRMYKVFKMCLFGDLFGWYVQKMKKILFILFICLPVAMFAQNEIRFQVDNFIELTILKQ